MQAHMPSPTSPPHIHTQIRTHKDTKHTHMHERTQTRIQVMYTQT